MNQLFLVTESLKDCRFFKQRVELGEFIFCRIIRRPHARVNSLELMIHQRLACRTRNVT